MADSSENNRLAVLLVDDEPSIRLTVRDALEAAGYDVTALGDGDEAMRRLAQRTFDVVISDIRLPKVDGLTIFRHVREHAPETAVVLITAYGDVGDAVSSLKDGAYDYLTKPFDNDELLLRVARIAERKALERELADARSKLGPARGKAQIVGRCPPMARLLGRIQTIATSDAPVLITGESGTGKELVARALHEQSPRAGKPFVTVNCAAFPETLLEAELFGHERGAFTGAVKRRDGRFQTAHGGTLFLDEIGEIPMLAQVKLLRVLQEGLIEPLGSDAPRQVDVRIISATHRNLKGRIAEGQFREDLFYRLNVLDIAVPPLRERRGDLPLLVQHFLQKHAAPGQVPPSIAPRAWAALSEYAFPGNVRELEHAIHHAVVLSAGSEIDLAHLPADIVGSVGDAPERAATFRPLGPAVKEFEREYLLRALSVADGAKSKAAELLGISRKNLWEKLRAHGISENEMAD